MSYRYANAIVKPGLNTLVQGAPIYTYGAWSWGNNNPYGQLGLGNTSNKNSPNQIGSLTNWLNLAGGFYHSIAVKDDGTLWAWGRNSQGQLGLGNTTNYSSPKQVGTLTNWLYIGNGYNHTIATTTTNTLYTWGNNSYGQLGNGNTTPRSSPAQVGALTNWLSPQAGFGSYSSLVTSY
jgi:alpha-tubulin suppressor-like RCC1 family protein